MARGDQIYAYREIVGVPYEHHGIDCGDGSVIHYSKSGEARIRRTSREAFAHSGAIYTKKVPTAFIPEFVVERAESRLGERQYDLFFNNCEHFADWCKTGGGQCVQLDNFGLRFSQIKMPGAGELAARAALNDSPAKTKVLFQEALNNIAIATKTILPNYKKVTNDMLTWHRVAQLALTKDREDLARAALHRKVAAQKTADKLKAQLSQLSELQLSLEQNKAIATGRIA